MKRIEFLGECKNGLPHIYRKNDFLLSFKTTFKDGDRLRWIVEKIAGKRSLAQNSYYRGVVLPILFSEVRAQGNDMSSDILHEELLNRFAPKIPVTNKNGEYFERPMRTHEMNKIQMSDFTTDIMNWAADFWQVRIPEPGEQTELL